MRNFSGEKRTVMTLVTLRPALLRPRIRLVVCSSLSASAILGWSAEALSQSYPAKPVRVIVPLAAGGPTDVLARTISQNLAETWGQGVVIDNPQQESTRAFLGRFKASSEAASSSSNVVTAVA